MTDAGALRLGHSPRREAQVEQERPADPPVTEGFGGPRRDRSAAPQATPRPAPQAARRDPPIGDAARRGTPATRLRALFAAPDGLRQAVLAAEVLGPPAAVRRAGRARRR